MFKYEIKSCFFCFIPFSMLMSRLSGLASALASQSNVSYTCSFQRTLEYESLTKTRWELQKLLRESDSFLCSWGREFLFNWGIFFFKDTLTISRGKICTPFLKRKAMGWHSGEGNIKDGSDESPLLTSPGWMHETSAQGWCTGKTQRDLVERKVGGGIGMGNTCKSMADSCQCVAKTTTIL